MCNGPLNPPVSNIDPFNFEVDLCGGFIFQLPASLFSDPEDGDMRKLSLWLTTPAGEFHFESGILCVSHVHFTTDKNINNAFCY